MVDQKQYRTEYDDLTDRQKQIYNNLFGGSLDADKQWEIDQQRRRDQEALAAQQSQQAQAQAADDSIPSRSLSDWGNDISRDVLSGFASVGKGATFLADHATRLAYDNSPLADLDEQGNTIPLGQTGFAKNAYAKLDDIQGYTSESMSPTAKAIHQKVDDAKGFIDTSKAYLTHPSAMVDDIMQSAPYTAVTAPVAAASKGIALLSGLGKEAADLFARRAVLGSIGATEGGDAGQQAEARVNKTTIADLMEHSPEYPQLADKYGPEKAREILAGRAGITSFAISAPLAMVASHALNTDALESKFFTSGDAQSFWGSLFREGGEETAQGLTGQIAQNVGEKQADDRVGVLDDAGKSAAQGLVVGVGQAGGMHAISKAKDLAFGKPTVNNDGVDKPINGEQIDYPHVDSSTVGGKPFESTANEPVAEAIVHTGDAANPDDRFKFELNPSSKPIAPAQDETLAANSDIGSIGGPGRAASRFGAQQQAEQQRADADRYKNAFDESTSYLDDNSTPFAGARAIDAKAKSDYTDALLNTRLPENMKDFRLLRSRYSDHLRNVANAMDTHGEALGKEPDSLLQHAAKNGGLNADAWAKEGIDPADAKVANSGFVKAFRKNGGMTPDDVAEFAHQNGFAGFTDKNGNLDANAALNAVNDELSGNKRYSSQDEVLLQAAQNAPVYVSELKGMGSPEEIKTAINKALTGEKLGARQVNIVQTILDSTNNHTRDNSSIQDKWDTRARTMLANRGQKALDDWRNRDEHDSDVTTHEAALHEIMADAVKHYGIDPASVEAAHTKYSKQYPSQNQLTAAMMSWVSANKQNPQEHLSHEQQTRKTESLRGSSSQPRALDSGLAVSPSSNTEEARGSQGGIEGGTSSQSGGDSARRDPGLRQSVEGKDIDGNWAEFSDKSGTLGIPRAEMPQIKAEHRGAMVNFLNARGIDHQEETIPAESLKPTQAEFSREKVARAAGFEGGSRSILVSGDDHVLDGHHQWLASREQGKDVKVIRLKAPIRKLLDAAHEFPSSTTDSSSSAPTTQKIGNNASGEVAHQDNAVPKDGGTQLYKLGDKTEKSISKEAAQAVIDRITKDWKIPVKIKTIQSLDDLPESVKSKLHKEGDEKEPLAMFDEDSGEVYINLSQVSDEDTVEKLIFHEVYTHLGLRRLFGHEISGIMTRLYMKLGAAEIDRLAKKYGVNMAAYEKAYQNNPLEQRQAVLAEELLAHMAEHNNPAIVRLAQEFIGKVRAWLVEHGFISLSKLSESDLRYLLKQSRESVTEGKQGDISGFIYSVNNYTKADAKNINAMRSEKFQTAVDKMPEETQSLIKQNDLIAAWAMISQREESFQLPTTRDKDLVDIVGALEGDHGFKAYEADEMAAMNKHGAEKAWRIVTPKKEKAAVYQKGDKVWIDVSDLSAGDDGKRIYNIVANYAFNNGKVFVGDPAGLSITAKSRRLENMLSSALKFGTTDHLQPHKRQTISSHGVPGLKWKRGDTEHNILEMINASYTAVKNQFPEIDDMVYNPKTDEIQYRDSGEKVTKDELNGLARSAREESAESQASGVNENASGDSASAKITAGRRTLERAILTGSILRGTSSERSGILDRLGEQRSERLKGLLYSFGAAEAETRPSGGFSVSEVGKKIPFVKDRILRNEQSRSLPPTLQESYKSLGDKSLYDKLKQEVKRQLTPQGLLPTAIYDLKIARDGEINANELQTRHTLRGFYDAVKSAYGIEYAVLKPGTKREINKVLRGEDNAQLAPSVIQALQDMRDDIKRLSMVYVRQLANEAAGLREEGKLAEADSKERLIETVSDNFDTYLNRSYRAFDDKNWPGKVPAKVYRDAVEFIASEYAGSGTVTPELIAKAEKRAHMILKEGTAFDSLGAFIAEGKLGSKDLSILKKRKDVPAPIRALLGEYDDAAVNYVKSVTKMSRLVHNTAFLHAMKNAAFDLGLLHESQNLELDATKKIAADSSEAYAPLNGLYTTPEFEQALKDAMGKHNPSAVYDAIVAANGMVKMGKTVLAPTTAFRNFMSSLFFTFANGHFDYSQGAKSIKAMQVYFKERGDQAVKDYMMKMRKLGVIYDSPYAGEMMDLLKDSRLADWVERKESALANATKASLEFSQKFYSFGDDFYKIIGFENEKAMLIKHKGLSESEAEKQAAERIRNTYPTYSMIGRGVNVLRRFPIVGSFISFPAEIIRTSYHITKYLHDDAKELGWSNPMVMRKVAGYAIASGAIAGISMLSAAMMGVGDDEDKAVRAMAPDWQKNSSFLWMGKDSKGNRQYIDLSFLDPYGYWKRPIMAVIKNESLGEAAVSGAKDLLSPFLGWDIAAQAIGETVFNSKSGGGKVYNEMDTGGDVALDIANHLRKALQPGFATNIERFILAAAGTKTASGKQFNMDEEVMGLFGWRVATFDPRTALYYQSFNYQQHKADAAKLLSSVATDANSVSDSELRHAYAQSMQARQEAFGDFEKIVAAARASGMTDLQLMVSLRASGVTAVDARALVNNQLPRYTPNQAMMKGAIKKAAVMFDDETKAEFTRRQRYLNDLRGKAGGLLLSDD